MRTGLPTIRSTGRGAALAALLALGACGGGELALPVAFDNVEIHAFSSVSQPREAAVSDDAAWATLWAEHTARLDPAPPAFAVNFGIQSVAAVFLGQLAGCDRPVIQAVERVGDTEIRVSYRVAKIEANQACTAVVTTPVHMVRFDNVPRLPVTFRRV